MGLFHTDSIAVTCSNVERSKQWWIDTFDCKQVELPDWDANPSDVALKLPGDDDPRIQLCDGSVEGGFGGMEHPILFCNKLQKAREYLLSRVVTPGPIQADGETQFFEILDPDENVIEICKEP